MIRDLIKDGDYPFLAANSVVLLVLGLIPSPLIMCIVDTRPSYDFVFLGLLAVNTLYAAYCFYRKKNRRIAKLFSHVGYLALAIYIVGFFYIRGYVHPQYLEFIDYGRYILIFLLISTIFCAAKSQKDGNAKYGVKS